MRKKQSFVNLKLLPCSHGQGMRMHKEPLPILSNNKYKYTEENPNKLYTNTRDQSMKNPEKETRYERIGANVFPLRNAGDNGGVNV
jgi:hypothetical protein